MDFEPDEVGNFQGFAQEVADVLEMSQSTRGPDIGFPAEDDLITDREIVKENSLLVAGPFNEGGHPGDKLGELSGMRFEVGMDADSGLWGHGVEIDRLTREIKLCEDSG